MKKLAIITTHPIQYNAPLFRLLHERKKTEIMIFYTWSQSAAGTKYDPGFKKEINWDIPLLDGYPYTFVNNISTEPGSHHKKGIDNPTLINEVKDWGADAVLVYGWNFTSHLQLMKYFHGKIPVFFRGDSTLIDEQPGLKKILRRLYLRRIFSFVDKAFYAGAANKAYFLAHGLKEDQLFFMPHAIDNNRFSANEENIRAGEELRQSLKIPSDAIVFLFAGKLESKKQPVMLLNTFKKINNERAFLIIAGSGELKEEITQLSAAQKNIKLLDFQNQQQMPALYASCDVFILPSKGPGETWGLAVNEAMAAGKAVIVSKACGVAYDAVKNGENGFVFEKNDEEALFNHMNLLSKDRTIVQRMGERSKEIIRDYNFIHDCEAVENAVNNNHI